jgi:glycosyltransferase involved in cell wall biosynthesis
MWKDKKRLLTNIPKLAVIGVSDWVVAEAKQSFLKDAKIIHRVYNWIDLSIFYPRNASGLRKQMRMEDTFIVLGVSAVWESGDRKGLDHFIKLAINIPNNYRIILIGSINYTEKIPENIVIIPKVNDADLLAQYFSLADVFLNLSLEETFGKVSAEALACGTPIIAIDSTANKELVPAGGGIVLPVLKIGSIIRALKEIEANTKSSYQNTCRNFAIKNFNLNNNINQYLDIYKRLLDE